jgi:UDP-N-acetylmuramoyl-L-alanyl-D-glutamate--2,6-diaminopimelate ligase
MSEPLLLSDLMPELGEANIKISGISSDSRSVRKNFLFVAIPGQRFDGLQFIPTAIQHGAIAVVVPKGTDPSLKQDSQQQNIAWIEVENTRLTLSHIAARFYKQQPETIVAVTGTNGKTSTVHFAQQLWQKMGYHAASLGTLGVRIGIQKSRSSDQEDAYTPSMTTPDTIALHAMLADLTASGISHVAMEASSHGLNQYRLDGVHIHAAGFTNLTRDHLDYHGTMEDYRAAKLRLFSDLLRPDGTAVVNADTFEYSLIKNLSQKRGFRLWSFGHKGEDLKLLSSQALPQGQKVTLRILNQEVELILPFVGAFQVENILCAAGLVLSRAEKRYQEVIDYLPTLTGVPGRLQLVSSPQHPFAVYVDYAHTPDALQNILKSLRPHAQTDTGQKAKIICVFGCGGNRDKGKRSLMGQVAVELADTIIVTDDNPRHEDPALIRQDIVRGIESRVTVIGDRRSAIQHAIHLAQEGDIVVIAGKGHEQGQIIGDHVEPFDDVSEAQKFL